VALYQCVRSDCVVALTIRPHLDKLAARHGYSPAGEFRDPASLTFARSGLAKAPRAFAPSPRSAFPCFFFFAGGGFKIEWAETGLGRASSKEEAVGKIQIQY